MKKANTTKRIVATKGTTNGAAAVSAYGELCRFGNYAEQIKNGAKYQGIRSNEFATTKKWNDVTAACDSYFKLLFNGASQKMLDASLRTVLATYELTEDQAEVVIKNWGKHSQIITRSFGQRLTEIAKDEIAKLREKWQEIEENDKLTAEERLVKQEELTHKMDDIRKGNNYETEQYRQNSLRRIMKQVEVKIIYAYYGMELGDENFQSDADRKANSKWRRLIKKADEAGVDAERTLAMFKTDNVDGLKKAIADARKAKSKAA